MGGGSAQRENAVSATTRLRIRVRGGVQGVGFRYFTRRKAHELGLVGYVRNQPDGGVEIEAEGPQDRLSDLLKAVKAGPPGARVQNVSSHFRPVLGTELEFDIRFTMF